MKRLWAILIALSLICPAELFAAQDQRPRPDLHHPHKSGELLITPRGRHTLDEILAQLAMKDVKYRRLSFQRQLLRGRLYHVKLSADDDATLAQAINDLQETGLVEHVSSNEYVHGLALPNDYNPAAQWYLSKINAPVAWGVSIGAASVIAAVCDSGIQSTHPDLTNQLPGINSAGGTSTEPTSNTLPGGQHGTAVAGVIGAVGNNGIGITGVNQVVSLLPVRVTNATDLLADVGAMVAGIQWAVDHGARVINYSWSGACTQVDIQSAAHYARQNNVLFVAAAGNDGQSSIPASCATPDMTIVGATNASDTRSSFSSYGPGISVVAPGENMKTTQPVSTYGLWEGTSLAAPVVTGVGALIFSLNPGLTVDLVQNFMYSTANRMGALSNSTIYGNGRVDAGAALTAAQNFLSASNQAPGVLIPAEASPSSLEGKTAVLSVLGRDINDPESSLLYTWSITSKPAGAADPTFSVNGTNAAKSTTVTFYKADPSTPYVFQVTLRDPGGLTATSSTSVQVLQAPSQVIISPNPAHAVPNGTLQFTATVYDLFGDVFAQSPTMYWTKLSGVGSIDLTTGLYSAGSSPGTAVIQAATAFFSPNVSATMNVTVGTSTAASITLQKKVTDTNNNPIVTIKQGNILKYTITYTNNGTAAAQTVTITDTVPANTTYQDSSITGGDTRSVSTDKRTLTWIINTVGTGATGSGTVTFQATVN